MRVSTSAGLAGALTLVAAWSLPLVAAEGTPFTIHMVQVMLTVAVAAPLVALAVAGRALDPVRRAPGLFPPLRSAGVTLLLVWAWHVPALHEAAQRHTSVFVLEHASLLLSAVWLWLAIMGGSFTRRTTTALPGLAALFFTVGHLTLLGALLSLSPRALYREGGAVAALFDQQRGGAIMLAATAAAGVAGALVLSRRLVRAVARSGLESA